MKEDQDDHTSTTRRPLPGFDSNPFDRLPAEQPASKQDSLESGKGGNTGYFSSLDEDDLNAGYEEPDRDTDFGPAYQEETAAEINEEEAFEALLPKDLESDDSALFAEQEAFLHSEASTLVTEPEREKTDFWSTADEMQKPWTEDENIWALEKTKAMPTGLQLGDTLDDADEASDEQWYEEDDEYGDEEFESERWPVSLIVIGALALLLVFAGVYGIVQDRSATQDQVRQLQASLATAVSPEEVEASRNALQAANAQARTLSSQVSDLRQENQRLLDTVAGLEAQVATLQEAPAPVAATAPTSAATPKPAPAASPAPAVTQPAAAATAASSSGWFVNFGSYGEEGIAKNWADKLAADFASVIVAPGTKDGRTYYRVRVVGLASRDAADRAARKLESTYGLPKLWVGRQ